MNSLIDKLQAAQAPIYRKLNDHHVKHLSGTECSVLRITRVAPNDPNRQFDFMGSTREKLSASVIIDNVIINHPYASKVEIFEKYTDALERVETGAIDIWEILPITMIIPFEGDIQTKAVAIKRGDIIVEILKDEHGNKIPLIMQVSRPYNSILVKTVVQRSYELTLFRGTLAKEIKDEIDKFIEEN